MNTLYAIEDVVPHRQDMCLLERITQWDQDAIEAELVVPEAGLFVEDDQVPAWVGIEYMAQAIAAWAGCRARAVRQATAAGLPARQPPLQQRAQQLPQRFAAARTGALRAVG